MGLKLPSGIMPAVFVPNKTNGSIDEDRLERPVRYLVNSGVGGYTYLARQ